MAIKNEGNFVSTKSVTLRQSPHLVIARHTAPWQIGFRRGSQRTFADGTPKGQGMQIRHVSEHFQQQRPNLSVNRTTPQKESWEEK
jgi:hypothetical protein